ncbi:hypothetical protein, partial [Pseudomonas amygdali]
NPGRFNVMRANSEGELPWVVIKARELDWGVLIDAFLVNAAKVGDRYAAQVFDDRSGRAENGSTVVTPPLKLACSQGMFKMFRSICGNDHYVVASEYRD